MREAKLAAKDAMKKQWRTFRCFMKALSETVESIFG